MACEIHCNQGLQGTTEFSNASFCWILIGWKNGNLWWNHRWRKRPHIFFLWRKKATITQPNSFKCRRTKGHQMCRRTRWNSLIHSSQKCLLMKMQTGTCSHMVWIKQRAMFPCIASWSINIPAAKGSSECSISKPWCCTRDLLLLSNSCWTQWRSRTYYCQPKRQWFSSWRSFCFKAKWSHCQIVTAVLGASCYNSFGNGW